MVGKIDPFIIIVVGVRGAIHKNSIDQLKVPKTSTKILMKNIHQNVIKYLTYLILNKRKLDNKQTPVAPPKGRGNLAQHRIPLPKGGITPCIASRDTMINTRPTDSYSHWYIDTGVVFSLSFLYFD